MSDLPEECQGSGPCYMFKEPEFSEGCRKRCRLRHKPPPRKGGLALAVLAILTGTDLKDLP